MMMQKKTANFLEKGKLVPSKCTLNITTIKPFCASTSLYNVYAQFVSSEEKKEFLANFTTLIVTRLAQKKIKDKI